VSLSPLKQLAKGYVLQGQDHHDVSSHDEFIRLANAFQRGFEEASRFGSGEIRKSAVTTEGEKMHLAGMLVTNESRRHEDSIHLCGGPSHVPKSEGPGAPSVWFEKIIGTGATRPGITTLGLAHSPALGSLVIPSSPRQPPYRTLGRALPDF